MKNLTMQEMNEQFKGCPVHINTYELNSKIYCVYGHFIGDKNINDVMIEYAENRAMGEMLGYLPTENYQ